MSEAAKLILPPVKPAFNAWPDVAPGKRPIGVWVLVQYKLAAAKTKSGLFLPDEVRENDQFSMSAARVVAIGEQAFTDEATGRQFPGAPWFQVGDFVRVPLTGGDQYKVDTDHGPVVFGFWKDAHVKAIDLAEADEYDRLWKKG